MNKESTTPNSIQTDLASVPLSTKGKSRLATFDIFPSYRDPLRNKQKMEENSNYQDFTLTFASNPALCVLTVTRLPLSIVVTYFYT